MRPAAIAIVVLGISTAAFAQGGAMGQTSLVLERSGGFIGMQQRLEIDAAMKHAVASDRRHGKTERDLTADETKQLGALLERAKADKAAPKSGPSSVADGFTVKLWIAGEAEPRASFGTLAMPLGKSDGSAWG